MARLSWLRFAVPLLLPFGGCGEPPAADSSDLMGRLEAAEALSDYQKRDDAFEDIAWVAAVSGDGEICLSAIQKISDFSAKDAAAEKCARRLIVHGKTEQAVSVAKVISDYSRRDEVLADIAAGG